MMNWQRVEEIELAKLNHLLLFVELVLSVGVCDRGCGFNISAIIES
jgi:hypothetical protein